MANLLLIIIVAAVAAALLAIRTNAVIVFFALVSGEILVQFANKNMTYINGHLDSSLIPHSFTITQPSAEIAILLVPPILVAAFLKHDQGISKWPLQIFPAVATGILGVLLVIPLLSSSLQHSVTQNKFWNLLEQYQIPIVAICIVASIVVAILMSHMHHSKSKHHKSHI
jgi:hypothetical protein